MEVGNISLREFNKKLLKNKANLNFKKLYKNDNYLIQTLRKTKKIRTENPAEQCEKNLEDILKRIYKDIKFLDDPKIKAINKENNIFKNDYNKLLEKFQNATLINLRDLIRIYKSKGYKIPNLNSNLFRVNPLIEENLNKLTYYFLTENNVSTKKEILIIKSLVFLHKLNKMINKNNKKKLQNTRRPSIDFSNNLNETENIKSLKKSIQDIKELIKNYSNTEENDSEFNDNKSKYNFKIKTLNLNDFENTSKSINNCNKFKEKSFTQRNQIFHKSLREENKRKNLNLDNSPKSNIFNNFNKVMRGKSDKLIEKRRKSHKIIYNMKYKNSEFKINNFETNSNYNSERKKDMREKKFINNFIGRKKILSNNLNKNKFSNVLNYKKLNLGKLEKKSKGNLPLFIRTQTNEKGNNNDLFFVKKKSNESKSRNYLNSQPFTNKTEFFHFTYKKLKKGNFENIEDYVRKYLNEVEYKSNDETNIIISKYDYKNFKNNLNEIESFIKKKELGRKTERLYLNNFISKKVSDSLKSMKEKEAQISKFNKIISAIGNK